MKQLSEMDSVFVFNETPQAPYHVASVLIYQSEGKPIRFSDIKQRIRERLPKSPVFRRRLVRVPFDYDQPYWIEDANFDLEYHVRHWALPKPGDWRQFCIEIARLHSRSLDLARPPWEMHVIEGLDNIKGMPAGCFALYIKIHHSAIDGASGTKLIEALHDLEPDVQPETAVDKWRGESVPLDADLLMRSMLKNATTMSRIPEVIGHILKSRKAEAKGFQGKPFRRHQVKNPTRFNQMVTPHRVFGGLRMDLQELKRIKNAAGDCTLNDVLLSIVGGALRRYLLEKSELPDESLVACVPISTRGRKRRDGEGSNSISGMLLFIRTDIEDPVERLRKVHEDAVMSKAYADAVGIERLATLTRSIPSGLQSLAMKTIASAGLNSSLPIAHTIITNVPGPQFPLYLCGAKALLWLSIGCPSHGCGLFHTITSYYGSVAITFITDRNMIPDPDFYHSCINSAYQELLAAVDVKGSKPPTPKSKKLSTSARGKASAKSSAKQAKKKVAKKPPSRKKQPATKRKTSGKNST